MKNLICDDCKKQPAIVRNYYGGEWKNLCKECQKRTPSDAWKPLTSWKPLINKRSN